MHRQSYKNVLSFDYIGCVTGDSSNSNFNFVSKKFTLEPIVQVAWSLGTKSLDTNWIFSLRGLSVAFTNTDLKPLNNNLQRINYQFFRVMMEKAVRRNCSKLVENHFSWKSTGKVFPKAPVRNSIPIVSNRIAMRKVINAEKRAHNKYSAICV